MNIRDVPILLLGVLAVVGMAIWRGGWPSKETMHDYIEMLNTKGGIILLLWFTSMVFFAVGMRLVYWGVNAIIDHRLPTDNALILSAFNWITGAAFGGAFGAMIKTMTGEGKNGNEPK